MTAIFNCIRITPLEGHSRATLESLENCPIDVSQLARAVEAKPENLLALSHDDWVFIGSDAGVAPCHLKFSCGHTITLRGPTLFIPLLSDRKNWHGSLADIDCKVPLASQIGLDLLSEHLCEGVGEAELQLWPNPNHSTSFPTLNTEDENEHQSGQLPAILAEIFSKLGGGAKIIKVKKGLDLRGSSWIQHFDYRLAEMKHAPTELEGQRFLDLPAYAISKHNFIPTPATLVLSLLSFYIDVVEQARQSGEISGEQAKARLDAAMEMLSFCRKQRSEADTADADAEWPLTVDQWPEDLRA